MRPEMAFTMILTKFWPPSAPIPQHDTTEWLDSRAFPQTEVARSLADVARINSFLGATKPLYDAVLEMIEGAGLARATVLDVGSGNGDFARRLIQRAQKRGIEVRVIGLDISQLHLNIARELTPPDAPLEWLCADVFALPLLDESVDIVTSSLFLHHFRPAQIEQLLGECSRVARCGWVMNDCARDGWALASFRVLRLFLARSVITRFDALASIRRAYTPEEMTEIISSCRGAAVRALFPYRLQVHWKKT